MNDEQVKILVIDDEQEWLDTLEVLFSMKDWDVETALSAEQGLTFLKDVEVDLILCDLAMPQMSGLDLLKKTSKENNRTPFIIMTGVGTIQSAVQAMQYGAYNYITKPFDSEKLEAIALEAIQFGRLRRQLRSTSEEEPRVFKKLCQ